MSGVMNGFFRYPTSLIDLSLVLFLKIFALSRSEDTVILRRLALLVFLPSLVAFEIDVGIPKC